MQNSSQYKIYPQIDLAAQKRLMNKAASQRALVDVNSLIQDVLELTQWELRKREVSVHMELATSIPVIMGDRVQLQQVILNLILNGMEAMMPVRRTHRGDQRP